MTNLLDWAAANPTPILAEIPDHVLERLCSDAARDGSDATARDVLILWAMTLADTNDLVLEEMPQSEILFWIQVVSAQLVGERLRRQGLVMRTAHSGASFSPPDDGYPFVLPAN